MTRNQEFWLIELWKNKDTYISITYHNPKVSVVTLSALVKMGFAVEIQCLFWKITQQGIERCKSIY